MIVSNIETKGKPSKTRGWCVSVPFPPGRLFSIPLVQDIHSVSLKKNLRGLSTTDNPHVAYILEQQCGPRRNTRGVVHVRQHFKANRRGARAKCAIGHVLVFLHLKPRGDERTLHNRQSVSNYKCKRANIKKGSDAINSSRYRCCKTCQRRNRNKKLKLYPPHHPLGHIIAFFAP